MTPPSRLLFIDANLDMRLAAWLSQRGRNAISAERAGLKDEIDPVVLRSVAKDYPGCVLVTGDDSMPGEHAEMIERLCLTIATVDGQLDPGWTQSNWKNETVHRWVHAMSNQKDATRRRYSPHRHGPWTRRKGRKHPATERD